MPPLVSIVIPCLNGEPWLAQAVESCLAQTYPCIEVVVVDDNSTDGSAGIAESFVRRDSRVSLVRRTRNEGISRAFNAGFDTAKGDLFARLACDDWLAPDAIETLAGALAEHPEAALAYGAMVSVDAAGKRLSVIDPPPPAEIVKRQAWLGLCVLWRRKVWEELGGFDPGYDTAEEHEYWVRIYTQRPVVKVEGPPRLFWRQHAGQISATARGEATVANARLVCKYFLPGSEHRPWLAKEYFDAQHQFRRAGKWRSALVCGIMSIWYGPAQLRAWKGLAGTLIKAGRASFP